MAGDTNVTARKAAMPAVAAGPVPPDFHWALVLLIGFVTCGLFWWVWWIVEGVLRKKGEIRQQRRFSW